MVESIGYMVQIDLNGVKMSVFVPVREHEEKFIKAFLYDAHGGDAYEVLSRTPKQN